MFILMLALTIRNTTDFPTPLGHPPWLFFLRVQDELKYRQASQQAWQDTLPPYTAPLAQFAVPTYEADPAMLPVPSAIDHFHRCFA